MKKRRKNKAACKICNFAMQKRVAFALCLERRFFIQSDFLIENGIFGKVLNEEMKGQIRENLPHE